MRPDPLGQLDEEVDLALLSAVWSLLSTPSSRWMIHWVVLRSAALANFASAISSDRTEPLGAAICRRVALCDR